MNDPVFTIVSRLDAKLAEFEEIPRSVSRLLAATLRDVHDPNAFVSLQQQRQEQQAFADIVSHCRAIVYAEVNQMVSDGVIQKGTNP